VKEGDVELALLEVTPLKKEEFVIVTADCN
jgi:hypothetical protein